MNRRHRNAASGIRQLRMEQCESRRVLSASTAAYADTLFSADFTIADLAINVEGQYLATPQGNGWTLLDGSTSLTPLPSQTLSFSDLAFRGDGRQLDLSATLDRSDFRSTIGDRDAADLFIDGDALELNGGGVLNGGGDGNVPLAPTTGASTGDDGDGVNSQNTRPDTVTPEDSPELSTGVTGSATDTPSDPVVADTPASWAPSVQIRRVSLTPAPPAGGEATGAGAVDLAALLLTPATSNPAVIARAEATAKDSAPVRETARDAALAVESWARTLPVPVEPTAISQPVAPHGTPSLGGTPLHSTLPGQAVPGGPRAARPTDLESGRSAQAPAQRGDRGADPSDSVALLTALLGGAVVWVSRRTGVKAESGCVERPRRESSPETG